MVERVLFVHAHPDDETLWTGGTIATLIERGAEVTVLTCTRGERGEVVVDDLSHLEGDGVALATERSKELAVAMDVLGVTDHRFLGETDARWPGRAPRQYTDSGMMWTSSSTDERRAAPLEHVDSASLTGAGQGEVAADIAAVISAVQPHVVVSYDEHGGYGHPDHVRAHRAARIAADVLGVPFFAIVAPGGRDGSVLEVDVAPVFEKKRNALLAYRTQLSVEGHEIVAGAIREPIRSIEAYRRVRAPDESFAGNGRLANTVTCILAAVVGAVAGATLTAVSGERMMVADTSVAWGFILVVFLVTALMFGLRLAFDTRIVVTCAAVAWAGMAVLVAIGTGIDQASLVWVIPILITGAAIAWPQPWRSWRGNIGVRE